jgi:putative ABC transport system permease protein
MSGPERIIRRLRSVLFRRRLEQELDEELQFHIERQIEANIKQGMAPREARTAALRLFGGVEQTKEACREAHGIGLFEELGSDVLYGLRMLKNNPGYSIVAVLVLMLGIGANTAVFSVVKGVLLSRLPFPEPDRIMTIWNTYSHLDDEQEDVSPPDFCDWREQNHSFAQLAAYEYFHYVLAGDPDPVRLRAARVSGDFFAALGVSPALGRPLLPADDHEGVHHVVVLSHRLWTGRFAADPAILGHTITLTGLDHTVVGVMPASFGFPHDVDLWTPLAYQPPFDPMLRRSVWFRTVARLEPGVTRAAAQADLSAIARRLGQLYPDTNQGRGVKIVSLYEQTVGDVRQALLVLMGAVGLVLLIACTNVINLSLARTTGRQQEIALRAAIGAGRQRLVRQLVTESLLLGLIGGTGGLLLAWVSVTVLRGLDPGSIPRLQEVQLDLPVLVFAFLVALAAGVVSGIVPALLATRTGFQGSLKQHSTRLTAGQRQHRLRGALVIGEIALAQVLLVGGCLLFQSFLHMRNVNPGFDPGDLLVSRFELSSQKYSGKDAREEFYRDAIERVETLPGVQAAALATTIPLHEVQLLYELVIEGRPRSLPAQYPSVGYNSITPDYFRTMGIRLQSGRFFTGADDARAEPVVIINESLARRFWPDQSPLGHSIRILPDSPDGSPPKRIIGVVEDVRQVALNAAARDEIYLPYAQHPWRACFLIVRSRAEPAGMVAALRHQIRLIDRDLALSDFQRMKVHVAESLSSPRFHTLVLGAFAALALTLAAGGVFGVTAYTTSQRARELAIRSALGAQRLDLLRLVLGKGLLHVLAGVFIGLVLALLVTRTLSGMLYDIVATDPMTYAAVGLVLSAVALAACYLPSRRPTKVDPVVALRCE